VSLPAWAAGVGFTVTVAVDVAVHPLLSVTVKWYVVVLPGLATGLGVLPELNPEVGFQLYVYTGVPPLAVGVPPNVTLPPLPEQYAPPLPALAANPLGTIVTCTWSVPVHPTASVTVRLYSVLVLIFFTYGFAIVSALSPPEGLQL
jgi:hypothetical protein